MAEVAGCLWYALDAAPVAYALLLTPGRCTANAGAVPRITGRAWTKEKPPDVSEGGCYSSVV